MICFISANNPNYVKCVNLLIKAGADVNSETVDSETALLFVADWGYVKCMKSLLQAGADVNKGRS